MTNSCIPDVKCKPYEFIVQVQVRVREGKNKQIQIYIVEVVNVGFCVV